MKIDLKKATLSDICNCDGAKETQMFFDFPLEEVNKILENNEKIKKEYNAALEEYDKDGDTIGAYDPHMEIQLYCGYGESFKDIGYAELGIGFANIDGTTVLTTVSLIPNVDFDDNDAIWLWNKGLQATS